MIRTDKKIANAALKLTKSYADCIEYRSESGNLNLMRDYRSIIRYVHLDIPPQDVEESIERLIQKDYFRLSKTYMGGYMFSVTSKLNHRFAFFWDDFTKKFWNGFIVGLISGVLSTVIGGLLLAYIQVVLGI